MTAVLKNNARPRETWSFWNTSVNIDSQCVLNCSALTGWYTRIVQRKSILTVTYLVKWETVLPWLAIIHHSLRKNSLLWTGSGKLPIQSHSQRYRAYQTKCSESGTLCNDSYGSIHKLQFKTTKMTAELLVTPWIKKFSLKTYSCQHLGLGPKMQAYRK